MADQERYRQHISEQFNEELDEVKNHMLEMGGVVEEQIANAVNALVAARSSDAERVLSRDAEVNALEVVIDDECSRILARRQPTASDLRLVLAISKVITDLERIGDHAGKIARQAINLSEQGNSPSGYVALRHIAAQVTDMLRDALDAFARLDVRAAVKVVKRDTVVDQEYGNAMRSLVTFMMEDPRVISSVLDEMWALRALERIGDHARNVAEHVIYLVKGLNVRHVDLGELIAQTEEHH